MQRGISTGLEITRQLVVFQQGLGVHADHVVDDELQARQADPRVGQLGKVKGPVRVAHVHHDLDRKSGIWDISMILCSKGRAPS
jgi:hypothetical protein